MRSFADTIQRPFGVRYNAYTQTVEVLSNAQKITAAMSELKGDICIVSSALKKISARDDNLDLKSLAALLQTELLLQTANEKTSELESTTIPDEPLR